jgi:hypothetical protein
MGKWKGIIDNIRKGNDKMKLYNLETDLKEENDIAQQHPDIVMKLAELIKQAHTEPENPKFRF